MSTYSGNVQDMCDRVRISNPIQEQDLTVDAVSFLIDQSWQRVAGTDQNRAERLFFQVNIYREKHKTETLIDLFAAQLHQSGKQHFAERWTDAKTADSTFLVAFQKATAVRVHWK